MKERRRIARKYLMYYSRVFNQKTGEVLGHLVDISAGGALLLSEKPLPVGEIFSLRMELPDELGQKQFLSFEARSAWSSQDTIPEFYDTGLELINPNHSTLTTIEHLIEAFGFKER